MNKDKSLGKPSAGRAPPPMAVEATALAESSRDELSFQTRFACITLNRDDRIRLINFNAREVSALVGVLGSVWPIQDVRVCGGAEEIKLQGFPWMERSNGDDQARRLVRRMLEALYDMGWVLLAAMDVSRGGYGKGDAPHTDSLVFRYENPPPPACDWLSISFDRTDKMKIVDAPPGDLAEALIAEFKANYRLKSHELQDGRLKLKFHGNRWQASGEESVMSRMLLLSLVGILENFGYSVYASVDQVNGSGLEADVLIVKRMKGWKSGMPTWHQGRTTTCLNYAKDVEATETASPAAS
ncbi:hypothetical protein DHEL01_v206979 [Diaporthe helianthi]|uniref:Uncharacterized protein n=1 Tax=Diaporthe helianthi TaxID=158607 RepID=A0A2P5HWL8_DIAHE|nr:hypothetical protein DHEL01_v206979 [Diaporthe helianthi]